MKPGFEQAQFGGALRIDGHAGILPLHPASYRVWWFSVPSNDTLWFRIPDVGTHRLTPGSFMVVFNGSSAGGGQMVFGNEEGNYWDFAQGVWVGYPNGNCLLAPGYVAKVYLMGFTTNDPYAPEAEAPSAESISPRPVNFDWKPYWILTRKPALPGLPKATVDA